MRAYVYCVVSEALLMSTQTLFNISFEQLREKFLCWLFKIWFHWNLNVNDAPQHFVSILVIMRRPSSEHFV